MKDILSDPSARGMKKGINLVVGDIFLRRSNGQAQADKSKEKGVVWPCEARSPSPTLSMAWWGWLWVSMRGLDSNNVMLGRLHRDLGGGVIC